MISIQACIASNSDQDSRVVVSLKYIYILGKDKNHIKRAHNFKKIFHQTTCVHDISS